MRLLLATLLLLMLTAAADACSCFPPPDAQTELSTSDAVFAGKVLSMSFVHDTIPGGGPAGKPAWVRSTVLIRFRVMAAWKGVRADTTVTLVTAPDGGMCGYPFRLRTEYVVYAMRSAKENRFGTSICSRTCSGSKALAEWDALGPPPKRSRRWFHGWKMQSASDKQDRQAA